MDDIASKLSRRRFLTNGLALFSIAGVAAGGILARSDVEQLIEKILRYHVGAGQMAPDAASSFAMDYAPRTSRSWKRRIASGSGLYLLPEFRSVLSERGRLRAERYDRTVVTDFLLSSTYVYETNAPIEYTGLDEYRVCNPFARLNS